MIKVCRFIDLLPNPEDDLKYAALCVDTNNELVNVEFDNFNDAYQFKRMLEDLPYGSFLVVQEELDG